MKSVSQIAAEASAVDDGFCNPLKLKFAQEARADAVSQIEQRGYSRDEALQMLDNADSGCGSVDWIPGDS